MRLIHFRWQYQFKMQPIALDSMKSPQRTACLPISLMMATVKGPAQVELFCNNGIQRIRLEIRSVCLFVIIAPSADTGCNDVQCSVESMWDKGSQWRFQPDCLAFMLSLFKGLCILEFQMEFSLMFTSIFRVMEIPQPVGHISNWWRKCPLQGFKATGRQISWKIHYKPFIMTQ